MIRKKKIRDENGTGEYFVIESLDFEKVNPIEYYTNSFILTQSSLMTDYFLFAKAPVELELIEKYSLTKATQKWLEKLEQIKKTVVPENLMAVLNAESKKEQVRLLKGVSIDSDQLIVFIFHAYTDHGYLLSQYTSEHYNKDLDLNKMPNAAELDKNNSVRKIGPTELSDGQIRQAIEQRKIIVSKFLDKGNRWHCLFLTFDSIGGKESWKNGQPHYHYISDRFGIPRAKVVEELRSRNYSLNSLPHIEISDRKP